MSKTKTLYRILQLADSQRKRLILATIALLVTSGLSLLYPQLIRLIIDQVQPGDSPDAVDTYVIGLFVLFLFVSGIAAVRMYLFEVAGEEIVMRLRQQLFDALMTQDIAFFDKEKSGSLVNRLSSDTTVVQNAATVNLSMALRFSLSAMGSIIILAFTSIELTVVMILIVPPVVVGTRIYGRWIRKLSTQVQDQLAQATAIAEESISGVRTIKTFNAEKIVKAQFGAGISKAFRLAQKRARSLATFGAFAGFFGYSAVCGVLWYGGRLYVTKVLTLGELTSFMLYTFTVAFSIGALGTVWQSFMKAAGATERVFEVIDQVPTIESGTVVPKESFQNITFKNVSFAYPSRSELMVTKNISLSLMKGQRKAIVGPSGAGKSTIAALLARLYDPSQGTVEINGIPLQELSLVWWREQIGVVYQEPMLFACSIAENLRLGKINAPDEDLWRVLKAARLDDFVKALPKGLQTQVGERGVQLSGGQRQRLAIARLLLKDPPVVILDEATSALDSKTEAEVKDALTVLLKNRSAIIIAHRLSTVIDADEIVYVEDGQIAGLGSHESLLEASEKYANLVAPQLVALTKQ